MGKFYENSTIFYYPWDQMFSAFWRRYPNPYSTHVLSEDTLHREFREGSLYSRRMLTKTNRPPKWGERFIKSSTVFIVEESYVNVEERSLVTYTRNIGYNRIMSIVEKVTYTPDPENAQHTVAKRMAWVESRMYGFRLAIEAFGLERFRKNCSQAVSGFNHILRIMYPNQGQESPNQGSTPVDRGPKNGHLTSMLKIDDAKEKLKEKAKQAKEIITRKSVEKISLNVDS